MTMAQPILALEGVVHRYNHGAGGGAPIEVLRGVSLQVHRGDSVAIVGPSGSGKSTLLTIMGAMAAPTSGVVRLDGQDITRFNPEQLADVRNRKIGFVFQSHHLLPQCSALENVLIPTLASRERGRADAHAATARELLASVGLGGRLHHRPGELSGGECQRVALVRALINDPVLVLADEPTGSLDGRSADAMGDLLVTLNRDRGMTLVVVTHSDRLASRLGRVLELRDGLLHAAGDAT